MDAKFRDQLCQALIVWNVSYFTLRQRQDWYLDFSGTDKNVSPLLRCSSALPEIARHAAKKVTWKQEKAVKRIRM